MKMYNKLIVKFLIIFTLWIMGMNICVAQCDGCAGCTGENEECFCELLDPDLYPSATGAVGPLPDGSICLSSVPGLGKRYCVIPREGIIVNEKALGYCPGGEYYYGTFLPLSDASFLLIFLLVIYGIFIYRKKKHQTT